MKPTLQSSEAALRELAAVCELAHEALNSSTPVVVPSRVRNVRRKLSRRHASHLTQLKGWLNAKRANRRGKVRRPQAWSELLAALSAQNEHVAASALALIERAVLAAYERAAESIWLDQAVRRLVRRQMSELERGLAAQRRQLENGQRSRSILRPLPTAA
jgi:hypothetical protein